MALLCLMPLVYCLLLDTESIKGTILNQSQVIDVSFPTAPWVHKQSSWSQTECGHIRISHIPSGSVNEIHQWLFVLSCLVFHWRIILPSCTNSFPTSSYVSTQINLRGVLLSIIMQTMGQNICNCDSLVGRSVWWHQLWSTFFAIAHLFQWDETTSSLIYPLNY